MHTRVYRVFFWLHVFLILNLDSVRSVTEKERLRNNETEQEDIFK